MLRGAGGRAGEKENVRHRARDIRDIDSLDDEHLAARVDPLLLKKTVENSRSRSLGHMGRYGWKSSQFRCTHIDIQTFEGVTEIGLH